MGGGGWVGLVVVLEFALSSRVDPRVRMEPLQKSRASDRAPVVPTASVVPQSVVEIGSRERKLLEVETEGVEPVHTHPETGVHLEDPGRPPLRRLQCIL